MRSFAVKILEDEVPAMSLDQGRVLKVAATIEKFLTPESDLGHLLHYTILRTLCEPPPDLETILRHDKVWDFMFRMRAGSPTQSPLIHLLAEARDCLVKTAASVCDGTVELHDLHTVLRSSDFTNLVVRRLRYTAFTPGVLEEQSKALALFDSQLAEVNVYVNFFCN